MVIRIGLILAIALITVGILMIVSKRMNKFSDEEAQKRFKESLEEYEKRKEGEK
jgi:hypothetical protein